MIEIAYLNTFRSNGIRKSTSDISNCWQPITVELVEVDGVNLHYTLVILKNNHDSGTYVSNVCHDGKQYDQTCGLFGR